MVRIRLRPTSWSVTMKSRMDVISQNGNDGLHYEYELDKSTGEVVKKYTKEDEMTWNYRIMKRTDQDGNEYYSLNEVFYKEKGKLSAYSEHDDIVGDSPEEIIDVLEMMLTDAKKDRPILTEDDFKA